MLKKILSNYYLNIVLKFLFLIILYSVCRILFYLFNIDLFPDILFSQLLTMLRGGLKFDISALLYLNSLWLLMVILPFKLRNNKSYLKTAMFIFIIFNTFGLFANCVDIIYYRVVMKRLTSTIFSELSNESNFASLFLPFFLDYWYITLAFIVLVVGLVYGHKYISKLAKPFIIEDWKFYIISILFLPVFAGLIVAGMRGGFLHSTRPITLSNAGEYIEKPNQMAIVLNSPFSIIRTIGKKDFQKKSYFPENEIEKIYTPCYNYEGEGEFKKKNIVVFIIESFGKEYSGLCNKDIQNYKGYTPFIDSLMTIGKAYTNVYANGRKSIDALPSILSSIPSIGGTPYVLSHRSSNKINSFASILKPYGYHSAFFHGAANGSMGFEAFTKIAQYDEYYGKTEYYKSHLNKNRSESENIWGVWDDRFFGFYVDKMNEFKQPFHTAIFTLTSHHPFELPNEFKEKFKGGKLEIHKTIEYTDYSIRKFIERASKMPWFNNTLFVFTSDHCSQSQFQKYKTSVGSSSIRLLFYCPSDKSLCGIDTTTIAQQTDILPTVLKYLNYKGGFIAFGNNLLDNNEKFGIKHNDGSHEILDNNYVLQFNELKSIGLYNYKKDFLMKNNLINTMPEVQNKLEHRIKAIIQQYNNRMIKNKLNVE